MRTGSIAARLRGFRLERGVSKRALTFELPLNYSTYANYESGFREPNCEVLLLLAHYFEVSVDYLVGRKRLPQKCRCGCCLDNGG